MAEWRYGDAQEIHRTYRPIAPTAPIDLSRDERRAVSHAPQAVACALLLAAMFSGCTPLTQQARAGHSSLGCMQSALQRRELAARDDASAHCVAAGLIARHCSRFEAALASIGKELRDMFGPGNAQWRDLESDRRGIECAATSATDTDLERCCARAIGR